MALTQVPNSMLVGPLSSGLMMSALDPRLGIAGDGIQDDTEPLQAALDEYGALYFPNAVYKITDTIELTDYNHITFQSHLAIIRGDISGPLIAAKDRLSDRHYFITIDGGRFDAVDKSGGSVGIDLSNVTYARIRDPFIQNCSYGVRVGGDHGGPGGAVSAYYNLVDGFIISDCTVGIATGTLGNSNMFKNGSIKSAVVGSEDDDNSDNTYDCVQYEVFTHSGHRISNSGDATVVSRVKDCRFENPSKTGDYSAAVAIRVGAASISARLRDNYISVVATGISDSGTDTIDEGNTIP